MAHPLVDLIAPPLCVACRGRLPDPGLVLCPSCVGALPWLGRTCPRCALPAHRGGGCPAARAAFDRAWAPLAHSGPARRLVHALKFDGALPVAGVMAAQLAAGLPRELRGRPIVPVPPQPLRRRRRGFDAVEVMAVRLARRTGAPVISCLARTDRSARHTRRGRRARAEQAVGIVTTGPVPPEVILLDDVHTTGATLEACARALRRAGVLRIAALTYARTL